MQCQYHQKHSRNWLRRFLKEAKNKLKTTIFLIRFDTCTTAMQSASPRRATARSDHLQGAIGSMNEFRPARPKLGTGSGPKLPKHPRRAPHRLVADHAQRTVDIHPSDVHHPLFIQCTRRRIFVLQSMQQPPIRRRPPRRPSSKARGSNVSDLRFRSVRHRRRRRAAHPVRRDRSPSPRRANPRHKRLR